MHVLFLEKFLDDVTVSPLSRQLLSLPRYPKRPLWDWGLPPLACYAQGLWGKSF